MDEKDAIILRKLMENGRTSYVELASAVGITEAAVRKRIKKLEEEGVIQGYTAIIDPSFMGFDAVAIIGIDAEPEAIFSVYESIRNLSSVRYTAMSSGDHMMLLEAWCRNREELDQLVKRIKSIKGVTRVCPALLMRRMEKTNWKI